MDLRRLKLVTLFTVCLFLYVVGVVLRLRQLFFMCGATGLLPLLAWLLTRLSLRAIRVRRLLPERLFEGEEAWVALEVVNISRWPRWMVGVEDGLPAGIEVAEGHRSRDFFPILWPEEKRILRYAIVPSLRGLYRWRDVLLVGVDPLGLFRVEKRFPLEGEVVVYPRPWEGMTMSVLGYSARSGGMERSPRLLPDGIEFHSTREYQPGDDLRRIHWKSTARTGKLTVIEFEGGELPQRWLVLDLQRGTHRGQGREASLEYAVKWAATVARESLQRGSAVGFWAQGRSLWEVPLHSHAEQWIRLLEVLAQVQADGEIPLARLLERNLALFRPAGALTLFTAHPDSALAEAIERCVAEKIWVECFFFPPETFEGKGIHLSSRRFIARLAALGIPVHCIPQGQPQGLRWEASHASARV